MKLHRSQKRNWTSAGFAILSAILMLACVSNAGAQANPVIVRVGYFPNITHAQALVGRANGAFEQALGPGVKLQWIAFNAGPAAIEAMFAEAIDLTYVGPNPTVAGYVRSQGAAVRVIAGAASGGAALVIRQGSGITKAADFHGKKVATPQLGNTQDVALRAWLRANGLKPREKGGDVQIVPTANPDQLTLFLRGQIDAAWAPEPWVARLVHEAGGQILIDERDLWPNKQFVATNLIVRPKFLKEHPDVVKKFLVAHVEITQWITKNPAQAKQVMNQQLAKEPGSKPLAAPVMDEAFGRLQVTVDPIRSSLQKSTQEAFDEGFLGKQQPDLSGLYDLTLLNEVLREKKASPVQ